MANSWNRLKTDTLKSWEAFEIYRDLGKDRTLKKVAEKLGKSETMIERWSARHNWKKRVGDYDRYQEKVKENKRQKDIEKALSSHVSISRLIQSKIVERIQSLKPEEINAASLANMFNVAVDVERKSLGIDNISSENEIVEDDGFLDALRGEVKEIWE